MLMAPPSNSNISNHTHTPRGQNITHHRRLRHTDHVTMIIIIIIVVIIIITTRYQNITQLIRKEKTGVVAFCCNWLHGQNIFPGMFWCNWLPDAFYSTCSQTKVSISLRMRPLCSPSKLPTRFKNGAMNSSLPQICTGNCAKIQTYFSQRHYNIPKVFCVIIWSFACLFDWN